MANSLAYNFCNKAFNLEKELNNLEESNDDETKKTKKGRRRKRLERTSYKRSRHMESSRPKSTSDEDEEHSFTQGTYKRKNSVAVPHNGGDMHDKGSANCHVTFQSGKQPKHLQTMKKNIVVVIEDPQPDATVTDFVGINKNLTKTHKRLKTSHIEPVLNVLEAEKRCSSSSIKVSQSNIVQLHTNDNNNVTDIDLGSGSGSVQTSISSIPTSDDREIAVNKDDIKSPGQMQPVKPLGETQKDKQKSVGSPTHREEEASKSLDLIKQTDKVTDGNGVTENTNIGDTESALEIEHSEKPKEIYKEHARGSNSHNKLNNIEKRSDDITNINETTDPSIQVGNDGQMASTTLHNKIGKTDIIPTQQGVLEKTKFKLLPAAFLQAKRFASTDMLESIQRDQITKECGTAIQSSHQDDEDKFARFTYLDDKKFRYLNEGLRWVEVLTFPFEYLRSTWHLSQNMQTFLNNANKLNISTNNLKFIVYFLCGRIEPEYFTIPVAPCKPSTVQALFDSPRLSFFYVIEVANQLPTLQHLISLISEWNGESNDVKQILEILVETELDKLPALPRDVMAELCPILLPSFVEYVKIRSPTVMTVNVHRQMLRVRNERLLAIFTEATQTEMVINKAHQEWWNMFYFKWGYRLCEESLSSIFHKILFTEQKDQKRTQAVCRVLKHGHDTHLHIHPELLNNTEIVKNIHGAPQIDCTNEDENTILKYVYRQISTASMIPKLNTSCLLIIQQLGMDKLIKVIFTTASLYRLLKNSIPHYRLMRMLIQLRYSEELTSYVQHYPVDYFLCRLRRDLEACSVADLEWFFKLGLVEDVMQKYYILLHWSLQQAKVYGYAAENPPYGDRSVVAMLRQVVHLLPVVTDTKLAAEMSLYGYLQVIFPTM